eukprot:TRINITY_DN464_c0_g1_i10.p1 TRINITY_DN464_c0_g1~~TRINITY_DN464_c0_g1_i10.p1  ORF type:complete len:185 (+),score=40.40 TRINITY_DN464_c0_g1_i10:984-1538(+)
MPLQHRNIILLYLLTIIVTYFERSEPYFRVLKILNVDKKLVLVQNKSEKKIQCELFFSLDSLEILSLGRNLIKQLAGIEPVADTLKQLWISYNFIEKLNGIEKCKNLRVLYISNNKVEKWSEFEKLQELPLLEDLLFIGNPLHEQYSKDERVWRLEVLKRLPNLKKLDGKFVSEDEREQARGQS